jgi:hypothetical protein
MNREPELGMTSASETHSPSTPQEIQIAVYFFFAPQEYDEHCSTHVLRPKVDNAR